MTCASSCASHKPRLLAAAPALVAEQINPQCKVDTRHAMHSEALGVMLLCTAIPQATHTLLLLAQGTLSVQIQLEQVTVQGWGVDGF